MSESDTSKNGNIKDLDSCHQPRQLGENSAPPAGDFREVIIMISTPTISEILREEFMIPFGISTYRLAKDIHVPVSRIQDILKDRRKITADTSLRLGKYFGIDEKYFLNMQNDIELRNKKIEMKEELDSIVALIA